MLLLMPFDLVKEALRASGIEKGGQVSFYTEGLDRLYQDFLAHIPTGLAKPRAKARLLFEWLWREKPSRYHAHASFRLNDVIDAQMSEDSPRVGNCLGLTLLYNCLLRKMGIGVGAVWLEYAFETGPHVLTVLPAKERVIDIENILPDGFDYNGHLNDDSRRLWGDKELVADIYHSSGTEFLEKGELDEALRHYDLALQLSPQYERAHLNKAILLDKIERNQQEN
jgi:tetratricopeptide (TPR) repeat protein